jgi:hypothetical protein
MSVLACSGQNKSFYSYQMKDSEKALYGKISDDLIQKFCDYHDSIQKDPVYASRYLLKKELTYYYGLLQNSKIDTALFISLLSSVKIPGASDSITHMGMNNALLFNTSKDLVTRYYNEYKDVPDMQAIQSFRNLFYHSGDCPYTPQLSLKYLLTALPPRLATNKRMANNAMEGIGNYLDSLVNWVLLFDPGSFILFKSGTAIAGDDAWKYDNHLFFKVHCIMGMQGKYFPWLLKLSSDTAILDPVMPRDEAVFFDNYKHPASLTFLFYVNTNNPSNVEICNVAEGTVLNITDIIPNRILKCLKPSNKAYLSVSVGGNYSSLDMSSPPANIDYKVNGQLSDGFHAEFSYFFRDGLLPYAFGLGVGAGYAIYSSELEINNHYDALQLEQEFFTRMVQANNIHQTSTISSLEIPLNLKFKYKFNNSLFNLILNVGAVYSLQLQSKYDLTDKGVITYTGENSVYYPATGETVTYLLEEIPEYGLITTSKLSLTDASTPLADYYLSGSVSLLGQWAFTGKIYAFAGFNFLYGFITNQNLNNKPYVLSERDGQVNNILFYSDKLTLKSFGIQAGVKFNLW